MNKYEMQNWWERNKDKVIAYTIMTSMIVFFIAIMTYYVVNDIDVHY